MTDDRMALRGQVSAKGYRLFHNAHRIQLKGESLRKPRPAEAVTA